MLVTRHRRAIPGAHEPFGAASPAWEAPLAPCPRGASVRGLIRRGPPARTDGFTLIEVLVALLVFALGLLGCAMLQMSVLQATHSAHQRTVASIVATDVAERLWLAVAGDLAITDWLDDWLDDWQERRRCGTDAGHVCLPELQVTVISEGIGHRVQVSWSELRFDDTSEGRSSFEYRVVLPSGAGP